MQQLSILLSMSSLLKNKKQFSSVFHFFKKHVILFSNHLSMQSNSTKHFYWKEEKEDCLKYCVFDLWKYFFLRRWLSNSTLSGLKKKWVSKSIEIRNQSKTGKYQEQREFSALVAMIDHLWSKHKDFFFFTFSNRNNLLIVFSMICQCLYLEI